MEPTRTKSAFWTVIIVLAAAAGGYFVFAPDESSAPAGEPASRPVARAPSVLRENPRFEDAQVLGEKALTKSQTDAIAKNKTAIMKTVGTERALSPEERSEIGNIMLTQAHLYNFTDEERDAVFDALRR